MEGSGAFAVTDLRQKIDENHTMDVLELFKYQMSFGLRFWFYGNLFGFRGTVFGGEGFVT